MYKLMYKPLSLVCLLLVLTPLASAKIVFKSKRDGHYEIYVMNDDGSNVQRLTTHPHTAGALVLSPGSPAWSPDGTQIAFDRVAQPENRGNIEKSEIFLMNSDGSGQQKIIAHPDFVMAWHPAWSPDGQRLAFSGNQAGKGPSTNIFTLQLSSQGLRQLTRNKAIGISAYFPAWSPDSRYIAYVQTAPKKWRTVYTMKSDGTRRQALIPEDGVFRYSPQWSPDGKQLLFGESEDGAAGPDRLILQNWVTKTRRVLKTPRSWIATSLCWMGSNHVLIPAHEPKKSEYDIYRYTLATDKIVNLTNSPGHDFAPDWISGALDVSEKDKLTTQWGEIKSRP